MSSSKKLEITQCLLTEDKVNDQWHMQTMEEYAAVNKSELILQRLREKRLNMLSRKKCKVQAVGTKKLFPPARIKGKSFTVVAFGERQLGN